MSKNKTDILLIKKYLNGELDARAMHQLEKRAQDDPFLMDAIEGYKDIKSDQQSQLDELSSRLQQRVSQKEKRIIPWRIITIAASVFIVFTIGWLWIYNSPRKTTSGNIQIVKQEVEKQSPSKAEPPAPQINNPIALNTPAAKEKHLEREKSVVEHKKLALANKIYDDELASAVAASPDTVLKDTDATPLNEVVVMGYATQHKKELTGNISPIQSSASVNDVLAGKAAGVQVKPNHDTAIGKKRNTSAKITIKGEVIDKGDGTPLPGVSINVTGTKTSTLTDTNGNFSLRVDSNKANLVIVFIGYNTLKINANNKDSLKMIALEPNTSSLNEVVALGYKSQKTEHKTKIAAHPQGGWSSYKKYLKENTTSPDGKTGTVKLSFMIDHNGAISEVKVVNGLSPATNQRAIYLINNGPHWIGNTSGQTEQVNVRISFAK